MRKRYLGGALVAALSLAFSGVAIATHEGSTFEVTANAKPKKAGTKDRPRALTFTLGMEGGPAEATGTPPTSTRIVVTLPRELVWNGKRWPRRARCSPSRATSEQSDSVCPRGSRIGRGHVTAIGGVGGTPITEEIDLRAYVTTRGNLGLFLSATAPVPINLMLEGKVRRRTITVDIPTNVQEPVPGVPTGIQTLNFTLNGKGRIRGSRRGILESVGCRRRWTVKVRNVYRHGSATDSASIRCRR